jgi:D-alanine-D-alanine ligase
MEKSLRIAVLMGGVSREREISLKSGRAVAQALREAGHDVVEFDVRSRDLSGLERVGAELAFIALHGEFGEDGQVQCLLERMDLPYTGSGPSASFVGLDKIESKRRFVIAAVPSPDYFAVTAEDDLRSRLATADAMGYPLVCKPAREGSSCGITVAHDSREFVAGICSALDHGPRVLVEKHVKGRELTVGILDGVPLPPIEIVPHREFFTYESKYVDADTEYVLQTNLPPRVHRRAQEISRRAFCALGCRQFARVDLIYGDDGNLYVLEVNTIPGMTERSLLPKAARLIGMDFVRLCDHLAWGARRRMKATGREILWDSNVLRQVG